MPRTVQCSPVGGSGTASLKKWRRPDPLELLRRAFDTKLYKYGISIVQYEHGQNLGQQGS
jgi:hypothetical protein